MKKHYLLGFIFTLLLAPLSSCNQEKDNRQEFEKLLNKNERIDSYKMIYQNDKTSISFKAAYTIYFKQYIDHNNKEKGTFLQKLEFGFRSLKDVNVLVTHGYTLYDRQYSSKGENEIAFLIRSNYLSMEHRYFGESLVQSKTSDNYWEYLTTYQAASDAHEVVTNFKNMLKGKWVSTGGSKSGMTTHMFNYYYPGDVDLYAPYVAPFCNDFNDLRMIKFVYEEAGDISYGETKAKQYRDEVLEYQLKMLSYRNVLSSKYYNDAIARGIKFNNYVNKDNLYDATILDFAIGFWQYYQSFKSLESILKLPETTQEEIESKMNRFYDFFVTYSGYDGYETDSEYEPYYIQAYAELGNYKLDFSYIREALDDKSLLTISEDEEDDLMYKMTFSEAELALPKKELMCPKINNMLKTTDQQFIIIYGASDPWYASRPDDVLDRDNIRIYVNEDHPHTADISSFPKSVKQEIINNIKAILGI